MIISLMSSSVDLILIKAEETTKISISWDKKESIVLVYNIQGIIQMMNMIEKHAII